MKKSDFKLVFYNTIKEIFPFFIGIFIPFAWYLVLLNHTTEHCFFTYRNILVTFLSFQLMMIKIPKQREYNKK